MFEHAKLKIKRANQHIEELRVILNDFLQTDFYRRRVESDKQAGRHTLTFEAQPFPDCIPLIVGDAMHNLRTALDFVAYDIVTLGGGPGDEAKFPIRMEEEDLVTALNGNQGAIQCAGADCITLIYDTIQPYKGGKGESLIALRDLDLADKHLHLIPVLSITGLGGVSGHTASALFLDTTFIAGPDGKLNVTFNSPVFELHDEGKPIFDVLFDKGHVLERQPIVPALQKLSQLVAGCVQAFEQTYLARTPGSGHTPPVAGSHPPTT